MVPSRRVLTVRPRRSTHRYTLLGTHNGTLDVQEGVTVKIFGHQNGTMHVEPRSTVRVRGAINGTVNVEPGAQVIVEAGARLAGTLHNDGLVIVRGAIGGARSGDGELRLEGNGYIKDPEVRDGVYYYHW